MRPLNPLTLPLKGQQFIEASAGTGKTFTIGLLYLRLLLEAELAIDEILVVTFTNSATQELRARIRLRIREALDILEDRTENPADALLVELLAVAAKDRQKSRELLKAALTGMDSAAIFTIHSFCQRILQEHAFESKAPFEIDFLESEQALRLMVMEDFWRRSFYGAPATKTAWAAATWKNPSNFLQLISMALSGMDAHCIPVIDGAELATRQETITSCLQRVVRRWAEVSEAVTAILEKPVCLSKNKKTGYSNDRVKAALEGMNTLCSSQEFPWLLPPCVELLAASEMDQKLIGKKVRTQHEFFDLFETFFTHHAEFLKDSALYVQQEALAFLQVEMERYKQIHSKMYFNDLLTRLDAALKREDGEILAETIATRFPVALVDEFQDTDPVQYAIFQKIYGTNQHKGLCMIGDPKQAIYSFRGADIFTYIHARRNVSEDNMYTMDTNYRASSAMVEGVNALFDTNAPFIFDEDIQFAPVQAGGPADKKPFTLNGEIAPPFNCLHLPAERYSRRPGKPISKEIARKAASELSSYTIANLLNQGEQSQALIGAEPVSAGDIAVLVRTHQEAAIMRQSLAKRGITSVYYSQDSIFSSPEAQQLQHLLAALVSPENDAQVRMCLLTDFFGMNGQELHQLHHHQRRWEELLLTIQGYRTCWKNQGLMPMLQQLLTREKSVFRILSQENGERKLTNVLHLAELLQEASSQQAGMEGLLRYLVAQIRKPDVGSASQQLRLESDENLVKIVTIHKAKGMEYPLVFLPFLWNSRPTTAKDILSFHDPDDGSHIIDMGTGNEQNLKLADRERLAEELRLLYVAVTRTQHSCFFCWGSISSMEQAALAYLFRAHQPLTISTKQTVTAAFNNNPKLIDFRSHPESLEASFQGSQQQGRKISAAIFKGRISKNWQITSYSQLVAAHSVSWKEKIGTEIYRGNSDTANSAAQAASLNVFNFPKGTSAGICLHSILEELDFRTPTTDSSRNMVVTQLKRSGFEEQWHDLVCQWIQTIVSTKLEVETDLCLEKILPQDRLDELGFHFSIQKLQLNSFNRLLSSHGIEPLPTPLYRRSPSIQGLLKGFIDLVFRYQNKYYIVDYKSNHLGNELDSYDPEQLGKVMGEHRYDIQYLIYTVALHRYLGRRIGNYDFNSHFGGVYYLFLRGMTGDDGLNGNLNDSANHGIFKARPSLQLIQTLDHYFQDMEPER